MTTEERASKNKFPHYSTQVSEMESNEPTPKGQDGKNFEEFKRQAGSQSPRNKRPSKADQGIFEGTQGEFSGQYDKEGHHLKSDGSPDMRFKENREEFSGKGFEYTTQPSGKGTPGNQGEFSGQYDMEGHHLKSDGSPDMRFKENRDEFGGKGYEGRSPGKGEIRTKGEESGLKEKSESREKESEMSDRDSTAMGERRNRSRGRTHRSSYGGTTNAGNVDTHGHTLKSDGTPDMRFKENRDELSGQGYEYSTSQQKGSRGGSQSGDRQRTSYGGTTNALNTDKQGHHLKSDGSPDMRFKENRDELSGQGYEYTTSRQKGSRGGSQYGSGTGGRNEGYTDDQGHHLKSDGSPDMRFKENRDELSGQGYEYTTSRPKSSQSRSRGRSSPRKSGRQGEFSGQFDREGHHLKENGTPDMRFKENRDELSGQGFENRGRSGSYRQGESETRKADQENRRRFEGTSRSRSTKRRMESRISTLAGGTPGAHSGQFDEEGHRLKQDGTPDMRYKENRYEFEGQGYSTTSRPHNRTGGTPGQFSGEFDEEGHHLKSSGLPDMRFKENRDEFSGEGLEQKRYGESSPRRSRGIIPSSRQNRTMMTIGVGGGRPGRSSGEFSSGHHLKSDGTPDMRFKENREDYSGQGYENTTSQGRSRGGSDYYEGYYRGDEFIYDDKLTPGQHSGLYDDEGKHLKSDGTPDFRFRENQRHQSTGRSYSRGRREQGEGYEGYSLGLRSNPSTRQPNLRDREFGEKPYRSNVRGDISLDEEEQAAIENATESFSKDTDNIRYGGGYMNKRTSQGFQNKYQPKFHNKGYEEQEEETRNRSRMDSDSTFNAFRSEGGKDRFKEKGDDDDDDGDVGKGSRGGTKGRDYQKSTQSSSQQGSSQQREGTQQKSYSKGRYSNRPYTQQKEKTDAHSISTIDEDVDEMLMDLDLKRPRRAYNYYIVEMKEKDGSTDNLIDITRKYGKKWRELPDDEKEKYHELARRDEKRFKENLDFVRNKLLAKGEFEGITAKTIYTDECCRKAIEKGESNIQGVRDEARENWRELSESEKEEYEYKKQMMEGFYGNFKSVQYITPVNLYIRDLMIKEKESTGQDLDPEFLREIWSNERDRTKKLYDDYARIVREERMQQRSGIVLASGVKPRRPLGPYRLFMARMAEEGRFKDKNVNVFKETARLWKSLSDEEKEKYNRISQRERLEYQVRKMEFVQELRKTYGKARTSFNLFARDIKDKIKDVEFEAGRVFEVLYDKWKKLPEEERNKYDEMAKEEKIESEKRREFVKHNLTDRKKRTPTPYAIYIRENAPKFKEENPNIDMKEVFIELGKMWSNMNDKEKDEYYKMYNKELDGDNEKRSSIGGVDYKYSKLEMTPTKKSKLGTLENNDRNTMRR
jgi:hypothetical protein